VSLDSRDARLLDSRPGSYRPGPSPRGRRRRPTRYRRGAGLRFPQRPSEVRYVRADVPAIRQPSVLGGASEG